MKNKHDEDIGLVGTSKTHPVHDPVERNLEDPPPNERHDSEPIKAVSGSEPAPADESSLPANFEDTPTTTREDMPDGFVRMDLLLKDEIPDLEYVPLLGCEGYIQKGNMILLAGEPGAGKTDLIFFQSVAWAKQGFCVAYLGEDPLPAWKARVQQLGLSEPLELYLRQPMDNSRTAIYEYIESLDADIIVIDTMRTFLPMADENDNTKACEALRPLVRILRERQAAGRAVTVILVHHLNKGSTGVSRDIAGAFSITANADVRLTLTKPPKCSDETTRVICGTARVHPVEDLHYIRKPDGEFVATSAPLVFDKEWAKEKIINGDILDANPKDTASISALLDDKVGRDTVTKALTQCAEQGEILRHPDISEGKKPGVSYAWSKPEKNQ